MAVDLTAQNIKSVMRSDASAPVKVLVYPPVLDTTEQINTIHFYINGVADIGFDKNLAKNPRLNGSGAAITNELGQVISRTKAQVSNALSSLENSTDVSGTLGKFGSSIKDAISQFGDDLEQQYHAMGKAIEANMAARGTAAAIKSRVRRLDTHIVLPMPEEGVAARYGVNYENANMGLLGGLGAGVANGSHAGEVIRNSSSALVRAALGGIAGYVSDNVIGGVSSVGDPRQIINAATRTVLNPRKEQLFSGVEYRTFNFSFTLTPSTEPECRRVRSIVETFKRHMLPALQDSSFYLQYPSEFDIQYYYQYKPNEWMNNLAACALTSFNVSYGAGSWSTLANGSPTTIHLDLHFLELEPLTRNRVESQGF